jgi:hypothetical protein
MADVLWIKNRGRDGWSSLLDVALDRSVETRNAHLYDSGLGTRRGGSTSVTATGVTMPINAMAEFIRGQDPTAAELYLVDASSGGTGTFYRCAAGASFTALTVGDPITGSPVFTSAVTLNGKLYLAYKSGVNRLHVYDPNNASANTVRRAGVAPFTAAATVADTGAGAYAATLRYYTCRMVEQQSSLVIRRSESNASVSFTPSGAGTAARITRPVSTNPDSATHWEVYGSTDNVTFYGPLSSIAIGVTTYDDSSTPSTWATTFDAEPSAGTYALFPAVKCIGTTGTRLYGLGVWETSAGDALAPKNGRFYFGPVLDSTATHDDERISNTTTIKGYIDLARNSGAADRGCTSSPVNNVIYAFQSQGVYGLLPTESATVPYRRVVFSTTIGNLAQQAIVTAVDRAGRPCAYFLDPNRGPYTVGGADGLRWCGKDVADLWATVNKDASVLVACGEWFSDRSQVIFLVATGASTTPNLALVLDPTEMEPDEQGDLRGGWITYDGDWVSSRCIRMFSNTLAATRSSTKVPYTGGASKLLRYNEAVNQDDTTNFQAYVTSGALTVQHRSIEVKKAYLLASAQSGVSVQQSLSRNTGDETARTSTVVLTPTGSQAHVLKKFEDTALQDAWAYQVTLGDAAAQNVAWVLHQYRHVVSVGSEL